MEWRVVLERDAETGERAVWCPELPGCTSAGDTKEEAILLFLEPTEINPEPGAIVYRIAV